MSANTTTPRPAAAVASLPTRHRREVPPKRSKLLPPGAEDLNVGQLYRELVRWPTMLWLPAAVAVIVMVALQSVLAAVPCAIVVSTLAICDATRRAARRVAARESAATVTELLPRPRFGAER
jgi:hypothetical protein